MTRAGLDKGSGCLLLHPVVDVIDDQTRGVEPQHSRTRQGDGLVGLDKTGPPLDRSTLVRGNGLSEVTFHRFLDRKLALHVREGTARFRLAKGLDR